MFLVCRCRKISIALTSILSRNVLYIVTALKSQALCFLNQATKTRSHIWQLWKIHESDEMQQRMNAGGSAVKEKNEIKYSIAVVSIACSCTRHMAV